MYLLWFCQGLEVFQPISGCARRAEPHRAALRPRGCPYGLHACPRPSGLWGGGGAGARVTRETFELGFDATEAHASTLDMICYRKINRLLYCWVFEECSFLKETFKIQHSFYTVLAFLPFLKNIGSFPGPH